MKNIVQSYDDNKFDVNLFMHFDEAEIIESRNYAKEILENGFKNMKPKYKEILMFLSEKGIKYEEIADELDLHVSTVRSRLCGGKKIFKNNVKNLL